MAKHSEGRGGRALEELNSLQVQAQNERAELFIEKLLRNLRW